MSTLVVLDYCTTEVLFISLSDDEVRKIEDEYENDTESWLSDSGLEEKFGFRVSDANWMVVEDTQPEIFRCNPQNGEKVQLHPFM